MQFVVIGYDGTDDGAPGRRMAVRENHLKGAAEMFDSDNWLFASAILDDDGRMIGSVIFCDYESREAMQKEWLDNEPYITGDVWRDVKIHRAQIAPHSFGK